MKSILCSIILSLSFVGTTLASIIPTESLLIINTDEVEVTIDDVIQKDFFHIAAFSEKTNSLDFVVAEEIKYIQIFTVAGTLKYQLPVMSNKLRISKKLFVKGEYRLGFILESNKSIEFTGVKVK